MKEERQKRLKNLGLWTWTWVATLALATFGPKFIWEENQFYTTMGLFDLPIAEFFLYEDK